MTNSQLVCLMTVCVFLLGVAAMWYAAELEHSIPNDPDLNRTDVKIEQRLKALEEKVDMAYLNFSTNLEITRNFIKQDRENIEYLTKRQFIIEVEIFPELMNNPDYQEHFENFPIK